MMMRHVMGVYFVAYALASSWAAVALAADPSRIPDDAHMAQWLLAPMPGADTQPVRLLALDQIVRHTPNRLRVELDGAQARTADWLHEAGFSLLEEHDPEGRRNYSIVSGILADQYPDMRIRAYLGGPQLSAALQPRRNFPALAVTIPWQAYTFAFEGFDDRRLGYALVSTFRSGNAKDRLQYGIALPLTIRSHPSVGVLLELRLRFGN